MVVGLRHYLYPSEPEKTRTLGPWRTAKYSDYTTFSRKGNGDPIAVIRLYRRSLHVEGCSLQAIGFGRIWTVESERGKGIGRALHDFTCAQMAEHGYAAVVGIARKDHFLHKGCKWTILNWDEVKKDQYLVGKSLIRSVVLKPGEWWIAPETLF